MINIKQEWVPKMGEKYWRVSNDGRAVMFSWWNDLDDFAHQNFLGIFPTKEEAEARAKGVREFIKGLK